MSSRPWDLVVLVSNPIFLDLMIRKCPRKLFTSHMNTYLVVDERVTSVEECEQVVDRYDNENFNNIIWISVDEVILYASNYLQELAKQRFNEHIIAVKFGIPTFVTKITRRRMMYVDDDVLLLRDPIEITQREGLYANFETLFSRCKWTNYSDLEMVNMLNDVFSLNIDMLDYNDARTGAGEFTFDPNPKFNSYFQNFWNHPWVQAQDEVWTRGQWWRLDQRFYSGYFRTVPDVWWCHSTKTRRRLYNKLPKGLSNGNLRWPYPTTPAIIHYAACSWKQAYVDWFMEHIPDGV